MKSIFSFMLVITMITSNASLIGSENIPNGRKQYKYDDGAYEPILQSPSCKISNHHVRARENIVLDGVISFAKKAILPKIEQPAPSNLKRNEIIKENIKPKSASPENLVDQRVILSAIEPSLQNIVSTTKSSASLEPVKNITILRPLTGNRQPNHPLFSKKYIHDTNLLSTIVEN